MEDDDDKDIDITLSGTQELDVSKESADVRQHYLRSPSPFTPYSPMDPGHESNYARGIGHPRLKLDEDPETQGHGVENVHVDDDSFISQTAVAMDEEAVQEAQNDRFEEVTRNNNQVLRDEVERLTLRKKEETARHN